MHTIGMYERKNAMKLGVVIAFGGESVEHEISILSAQQVMAAMDSTIYDIIPLYISKNGRMYYDDDLQSMDLYQDLTMIEQQYMEVTLLHRAQQNYIVPVKHHFFAKEKVFDIVLPVLHGTHGEDGTFQGFLSTLKIPYVGCSVLGAALGQDKIIMKQVLEDSGIPVTPWFFWTLATPMNDAFFRKAQRLGYPLVIKPANLGSSIGVAVVHNEVELHKEMLVAYQYDRRVVIEKCIQHVQEINCSVLGDEESCEISMLEEVFGKEEILRYDDKYSSKMASKDTMHGAHTIPADVDEDQRLEIQQLAQETFIHLCASGVSRIDFLLNKESRDLYVNEINTIPGSLAFYLWAKSGVSFPELIDRLLTIARRRYAKEQQRIYSYSTNILALQGKGMKVK